MERSSSSNIKPQQAGIFSESFRNGCDSPAILSQVPPDSGPLSGDCSLAPLLLIQNPQPTPAPSPTPILVPPATDSTAEPSPRKRCRPLDSGLSPSEEKIARAERNRQFARDSRERKRRYVLGLELEVSSLRRELEVYRQRLSRYETIEKQREIAEAETQVVVHSAAAEMLRTGENPSEFVRLVGQQLDRMMEERRKAMEQLARITLEVSVPLSLRLFLWEAENKIDIRNGPESVCRVMGCKLSPSEIEAVLAHVNSSHGDRDSYHEMCTQVTAISQRIRGNVRRLIDAQKALQLDSLRVWRYLGKHFFSHCTGGNAVDCLRYMPRLQGRSELSDESVFRIRREDFCMDETAADVLVDKSDGEGEGEGGAKRKANTEQ